MSLPHFAKNLLPRAAAHLRRLPQILADPLGRDPPPALLLHHFAASAAKGGAALADEWQVVTDETFGGTSRADVRLSERGTLLFEGEICTDLSDGAAIKKGGYCGIKHTWGLGRDLGYYDAFVVRLRGDERPYFFNAKTEGWFVDGFCQAPFRLPNGEEEGGSGEWGALTLPFAAFQRTVRAAVVQQQHQIDTRNVTSLGVYCSGEPGPFRLEIDCVVAVRSRGVEGEQAREFCRKVFAGELRDV